MRGTRVKALRATGISQPGRKNGGSGATRGSVGGGWFWRTAKVGRMAKAGHGIRRR